MDVERFNIFEKILDVWFSGIEFLINMLPINVTERIASISPPEFVSWAVCFFPTDVIVFAVGMFSTSYLIFIVWSIVEWLYKKIPGVS